MYWQDQLYVYVFSKHTPEVGSICMLSILSRPILHMRRHIIADEIIGVCLYYILVV